MFDTAQPQTGFMLQTAMCLSFNLRLEEILEMTEDITTRGWVLNPNWMKPDVRLFTEEEEQIIHILKFNYHLSNGFGVAENFSLKKCWLTFLLKPFPLTDKNHMLLWALVS